MKHCFILPILILLAQGAHAQQTMPPAIAGPAAFVKGSYIATASAGFINGYRSAYSVPAGFEKANTTGFLPVYARIEYAASNRVGLAVSAAANSIVFSSFRLNNGYNGPIKRYSSNRWRLFSTGLAAYYHFGHVLNNEKLDLFAGGGICLNNISESASPSGDSTIEMRSHTATPLLKAGARYYVTPKFSVFADAGYDKLSVFSIGMSCRFFKNSKQQAQPASK